MAGGIKGNDIEISFLQAAYQFMPSVRIAFPSVYQQHCIAVTLPAIGLHLKPRHTFFPAFGILEKGNLPGEDPALPHFTKSSECKVGRILARYVREDIKKRPIGFREYLLDVLIHF
jgi:hypothetical protein